MFDIDYVLPLASQSDEGDPFTRDKIPAVLPDTVKTGESVNFAEMATNTNRNLVDAIVTKRGSTKKLSLEYNYDDVGNVVRVITDTGTEATATTGWTGW